MTIIRANIPDELFQELRKHVDHHGQISAIIRRAVVEFVKQARTENHINEASHVVTPSPEPVPVPVPVKKGRKPKEKKVAEY